MEVWGHGGLEAHCRRADCGGICLKSFGVLETLEVLARGTGGVPRLLNQAAHRALVLAHGIGAECVDVEAALEALAVLGLADAAVESGEAGLMPSPGQKDCPVRMTLLEGETAEGETSGDESEEPGEMSRLRRPVVGPRTA